MNPVEIKIVRITIAGILNHSDDIQIRVNDGEEYVTGWTRDQDAILAAMFSTDADILSFRTNDKSQRGSVVFIYGNGHDVISDYSTGEFTDQVLKAGIDAADQIASF